MLSDGATVPFIARYRKEATGLLDEVAIAAIRDRLEQLVALDKRRVSIVGSLQERDLLCDELSARLNAAKSLSELEDIYLPYRPKRRTRASIAREKGLEPLAQKLLKDNTCDLLAEAASFLDSEKGVHSVEEALCGARDIIAEWVNEDQKARCLVRRFWLERSFFDCIAQKGKEADGAKYKDYFDWREPVNKTPSHRILAMLRGEKEGFLNLEIAPEPQEIVKELESMFVTGKSPAAEQVRLAVQDSYKRLLAPSMETELRQLVKRRADAEAIAVFAANLRQLLLAPLFGHKRVLAVDPGFRTGCKIVCLDETGKLLHTDVIYPHTESGANASGAAGAAARVLKLCQQYKIDAIAIGNGTAGRETEAFIGKALSASSCPDKKIQVFMVNESGASIYSASAAAREEFPDQDITVRGAVSIGRRLMDPLAELVKIDPKSIGVGQYQHDVDQGDLKKSLDDVVVSCVNTVGVEVNSASCQLLSYVSGLGPQLAANILKWRSENGSFQSREQLRKVPRMGPKAFEQAAGFLRIAGASNPLDASAVHPESYSVVDSMARDLGCSVADLTVSESLRKRIEVRRYVTDKVGLPTLNDILSELSRPGRDPREIMESVQFAAGVNTPADLKPGMKLPGIVTNVTAFGAFVDIGVHQDGLVHVSQLSDNFVKDPSQVVKVQQKVNVTVVSVDLERKRIALSMRSGK